MLSKRHECTTIILSLRKFMKDYIFPTELIQNILRLYLDQNPPILMLFTSSICRHSENLLQKWYPNNNVPFGESITCKISKLYPTQKIMHVTFEDFSGGGTSHYIPSNLKRYITWWPMIMLISTATWNKMLVYPDDNITEGIHFYNGKFQGNQLCYTSKYRTYFDEIITWLETCNYK